MRVITVPCLKDNYAYLLVNAHGEAVVIDPSEAPPVQTVLQREGIRLRAIWLTHHHWDHVGGVAELCAAWPGIQVVGSRYDASQDRVPGLTDAVDHGSQLDHGEERFEVLAVPGHTLGAIAYRSSSCLFTGDTLFLGGCGRVFEGTLPQMQASLARLRALSPSLLIYPGHEYTVANLRFGLTIEPNAPALQRRLLECQALRARGEPTVPGRLGEELETNVLLRWDAPAVIAHAQVGDDPAQVFAAIRRAKDRF